MRIAIDTNVLVYAAGMDDQRRKSIASDCFAAITAHTGFVPMQVLDEFFRVLRRKFRFSAHEATELLNDYRSSFIILPTTEITLDGALELCAQHQFDIWDAIILAAAAQAGCNMLLSEDGHSGVQWRGVIVVDPFASELHPLAVQLLTGK